MKLSASATAAIMRIIQQDQPGVTFAQVNIVNPNVGIIVVPIRASRPVSSVGPALPVTPASIVPQQWHA